MVVLARQQKKVLCNGEDIKDSTNDYDWLGFGKYFWEANPRRALEWAHQKYKNSDTEPDVIGACIDISQCLNLLDSSNLLLLRNAYEVLKIREKYSRFQMPENTLHRGNDVLIRRRDCLIVNFTCKLRKLTHKNSPFTTVRGVFWEGEELYPGAGMREKNHIQICVRDTKAILCYFNPRFFDKKNILKNLKAKKRAVQS